MFSIPSSGIERTVLSTYPVKELPGYESRMIVLAFAPGAKVEPHTHPVPSTGVIIKGTLISQYEDQEVETYTEGEGYNDFALAPHLRTENASQTEPLVMIVNFVIKVGEPAVNPL